MVSLDRSFMVDPLSYFSFKPVLQDWCTKGCGICYPVYGMVHIKEPLLLIGKNIPCCDSRFPLLLSEWSFIICPTSYNRKYNVLSASLNKTFSSFFITPIVEHWLGKYVEARLLALRTIMTPLALLTEMKCWRVDQWYNHTGCACLVWDWSLLPSHWWTCISQINNYSVKSEVNCSVHTSVQCMILNRIQLQARDVQYVSLAFDCV